MDSGFKHTASINDDEKFVLSSFMFVNRIYRRLITWLNLVLVNLSPTYGRNIYPVYYSFILVESLVS